MEKGLQELIREARRELRRTSGVPLTAEEQAEEQRTAEVEQMENFLLFARFSAGNCADLYGSSRI